MRNIIIVNLLLLTISSSYSNEKYDSIINNFLDTTIVPTQEYKYPDLMLFQFLNINWNLFHQFSGNDLQSLVPCKNCQVRHILRHDKTIIWDKVYVYGENSQRAIPKADESASKFFALIGCSYAMGQGLNNDETIAANISYLNPNYAPYSYADMGIGPHSNLKMLENESFKNSIKEESGIFVYLFQEDIHMARANGYMKELQWVHQSPYYEWEGEDIVSYGNFEEKRPITNYFYRKIQSLFNVLGIHNNFPRVTDNHRELLCKIVEKMKAKTEESYPQSKFVVYNYPFAANASEYTKECFKRKNITYIENTKSLSDHSKIQEYIYKNDGHPNPAGAQYIAKEIATDLEL